MGLVLVAMSGVVEGLTMAEAELNMLVGRTLLATARVGAGVGRCCHVGRLRFPRLDGAPATMKL
jgi:hypothetical protein